MTDDPNENAPRLLTRKQAAAYCGASVPTFDKWVRAGTLPGAVSIINRWDKKAIDAALDKRSGIADASNGDHWAQMKREFDAHKAARAAKILMTSDGVPFKKSGREGSR
jgi:predicted DNA-binding transcriptional regulator AlpA